MKTLEEIAYDTALVLGLVAAAMLLAQWNLKFSVDATQLYDELYEQAAAEADAGTLGWLAAAGYGYQALREENAKRVGRMSRISGALGVLMVVQTLAWLAGYLDRNRGGPRRVVATTAATAAREVTADVGATSPLTAPAAPRARSRRDP